MKSIPTAGLMITFTFAAAAQTTPTGPKLTTKNSRQLWLFGGAKTHDQWRSFGPRRDPDRALRRSRWFPKPSPMWDNVGSCRITAVLSGRLSGGKARHVEHDVHAAAPGPVRHHRGPRRG